MTTTEVSTTDDVVVGPHSSPSLDLWVRPREPLKANPNLLPPLESTPPRPRFRILIADDDAFIVEIMSRILHLSGYEAVATVDGEEAWQTYLERGCDLLLTDQDMPRLSGLGLVERIRLRGDSVPIVLISGRVTRDDIPAYLRDQINAVLPKPFTLDSLITTVRSCLHPQAS